MFEAIYPLRLLVIEIVTIPLLAEAQDVQAHHRRPTPAICCTSRGVATPAGRLGGDIVTTSLFV